MNNKILKSGKTEKTILIAHRGESYLAPENTLEAINMAWEKGARAVEIDVQLTSDNKIVVIHDKNTRRVGDITKSVKRSSLKELKIVDVGLFKGTQWKGARIPALYEVLQTIPAHGKLIVEIKSGAKIIPYILNELERSGLENHQIEIISFNYRILAELKRQAPFYKILWLLALDYFWPRWILRINNKKLLRKVSDAGLDGINVWAGEVLDKTFINYFKGENLSVYTWTVNSPKMASSLREKGVDAITTDRQEWLCKQLQSF